MNLPSIKYEYAFKCVLTDLNVSSDGSKPLMANNPRIFGNEPATSIFGLIGLEF